MPETLIRILAWIWIKLGLQTGLTTDAYILYLDTNDNFFVSGRRIELPFNNFLPRFYL